MCLRHKNMVTHMKMSEQVHSCNNESNERRLDGTHVTPYNRYHSIVIFNM